jgi:hypothetical protein
MYDNDETRRRIHMANTEHKSGQRQTSQKQLPFSDEELILMLFCYLRFHENTLSPGMPFVLALSSLIQDLLVQSGRVLPSEKADYRKPDGICMNIRKFADCDPESNKGKKLDASAGMFRTWNEYAEQPDKHDAAISMIIKKYCFDKKNYSRLFE